MKTGVIIPNFSWKVEDAIEVADRAAEAGIDGVFCYDHLWPMGDPTRPAIAPFPLLAAIATTHADLEVGTLVARIGMVSDDVLVSQFDALCSVAQGRVVAAMGTGDHLSKAENLAYGIGYDAAEVRRASLERVASELLASGVCVWIGGGAPATMAIAEQVGCAVNMWQASPEQLRAQSARTEVTWAGLVDKDPSAAATQIDEVAAAGATWAVVGWPASLEAVVEAAQRR